MLDVQSINEKNGAPIMLPSRDSALIPTKIMMREA